ncbi:MAG TPA: ester cyclase [Microlunatus sp.]|nr:ester cyclase [Microlunatus sp.]
MDRDQLAESYTRYLGRCNEHRFATLGEFVADSVNAPEQDLSGYIAGLESVVAGFPDYRWTVRQLAVDPPFLAALLWGEGTHTGPFRGIAPTGRRVRTQELVMYRFADGRIVNCWGDLGSTVRDELVSGG